MAALALMTAACSNSDNDILTPAEQPAKAQGIPFTATISMGESASTRALSEDNVNNKIVATWAVDDKVALIHNGVKDEMTVSAVNAGVATITGTITGYPSYPSDGDAVTIIYPATAADGTTGNVKANLLAAQDGTLATIAANYDVRKGTGTLKVSGTASLNGNVSLTNQFAIFKFTLSGQSIDATHPLVIKKGENEVVTTVTPASSMTSVYVAMPAAASSTYRFIVTTDNNKYIKSGTAAITAGNYYQTTLDLSTPRYPLALASATVDDLGSVIASNGKIYLKNAAIPSGESAVAKIAYLGDGDNSDDTYNHGLALALADVSETKWCLQWSETCLPTQYSTAETAKGDMAGIANTDYLIDHAPAGHTHNAAKAARDYSVTRPTGTSAWFLPSAGQWDKMANAAGGYENLGLPKADGYWSSTESNASSDAGNHSSAWYFDADVHDGKWEDNRKDDLNHVRACLAF